MASRVGPRSVKDATRFTSTIPHATSKTSSSAASAAAAASPSDKAQAKTASQRAPPRVPGETPEQRVRRLRLAHLAAQRAQVSKTDRIIDASRRVFDVAHRWTVTGLVLFTVIAAVVSVYSVWDMVRYNRARRSEWVVTQRRLEDDALAAARVAYIKGEATAEQAALVDAANAEAEAAGTRLPPLMAPPEHRTHFEERVKPAFETTAGEQGTGVWGVMSGLWGGGGGKEASTETAAPAAGSESSAEHVRSKASEAWDRELENQRRGGSLDQLGLETSGGAKNPPGKRGWWPW